MDYGFGSGRFGEDLFGRADSARGAVWFRSIPPRVRELDSLGDGDLEGLLSPMIEELRGLYIEASQDALEGVSAVTARAGSENELVLNVDRVEPDPSSTIKRVYLTASQQSTSGLLKIWPASNEFAELGAIDGWRALINGSLYLVTKVDADKGFLEVNTTQSIGATLIVRPPDLLSLLGAARGILVDRQDPAPFTRRVLYRHTLLRDLKVCFRFFRVMGLLYGLEIEVSALYCISKAWHDAINAKNPGEAFEFPPGSGKYFTAKTPFGVLFDEIPADAVPLDVSEDIDFSLEVTGATDEGNNRWCLDVAATDVPKLDLILSLGYWQWIDPSGKVHWIEAVERGLNNRICVLSSQSPSVGIGTLRLKVRRMCPPGYKAAAAYRVVIKPGEVLTVAGASLARVYDRAEEKINYYTPKHIRLLLLVFTAPQSNMINAISSVMGLDRVTDTVPLDIFITNKFDAIAADAQVLDAGAFFITGSSTIT